MEKTSRDNISYVEKNCPFAANEKVYMFSATDQTSTWMSIIESKCNKVVLGVGMSNHVSVG